jgi:peptidoglycan L-alanyl-D-glutamate endopeptidase CwlK
MTFSLGPRSVANLAGLHPGLLGIVHGAIVSTSVDFGVTGKAVRTAAEQHKLFLQRVTQKDGYKSKSNHQPKEDGFGHAVDLTPFVGGKYIVTEDAWDYYPAIASGMSLSAKALGLAHHLKWGCNWLETMDRYGSTIADMKAAMERYKVNHPGKDFLDGPHFEFV